MLGAKLERPENKGRGVFGGKGEQEAIAELVPPYLRHEEKQSTSSFRGGARREKEAKEGDEIAKPVW